MELLLYWGTLCLAIFKLTIASDIQDIEQPLTECNETKSRILSRRKRFLVFPEGSSVQIGM